MTSLFEPRLFGFNKAGEGVLVGEEGCLAVKDCSDCLVMSALSSNVQAEVFICVSVCMQMVMGLLMSLLIIAFGAIFQLSLFLHNSFGILFFLFFLFQLAMASFAFLCSIPIRKVGRLVMTPCSVSVPVPLRCMPHLAPCL